eukprot:TRINITY_DN2907_c0_g1_i1.p1 TRINITY_DN2907_c0_g1~~TRINITY_DN2907_c0_g1_i1.p1  ORF type:complete len:452 (-),score=107.77 TRINITY_DN2907_c0_g1_i1:57-1412(-)
MFHSGLRSLYGKSTTSHTAQNPRFRRWTSNVHRDEPRNISRSFANSKRDHYETLGISKNASKDEIKKAFREIAKKNHPDINKNDPNAEHLFKEASIAYDILSDDQKRQMYDQYGDVDMDGGGPEMNMEDIFSQMGFSFGGSGRRNRGPQKTEAIVQQVEVSLEDFFMGKEIEIPITRNATCGTCSGSGTKSGTSAKKCKTCNGKGMRTVMRQMGPGMLSQSVEPCGSCEGQGERISNEDKCSTCNGKKIVRKKENLSIEIEKGMRPGQQMVFADKGNEAPGMKRGDVGIIIVEKPNDKFVRAGDDLVMEQKIPLIESLSGTEFVIEQLDGRQLLFRSSPNEVIKPGDTRIVRGEGMPGDYGARGDLYVKFDVEFPSSSFLTPEMIKNLEPNLPPRNPKIDVTDEMHETELRKPLRSQTPGANQRSQRKSRRSRSNDEEDDGNEGPAQCVQQ